MDVTEIVKAKLPADKLPNDTIISMYVAEVRQAILTYCNRSDIPMELTFVHANMVIDMIFEENQRIDPENSKVATSIQEGDTRVELGNNKVSASALSTQQMIYNYQTQLNKFRKLRW
ncbi:hypothetical protein [Bacillus sp. S/N-304-OC-R1]|uniref:hypothetical protein n=1 Tax=Bacillus sp. S/N-304-OC-R1 TaxID=2758034 RepID=UPI001C8E9D6C|nr:hypothetical protein [Bacillus sp. S/N-304-OC-R1]MBY0122158.1 hypothetical protein [Bacillus sp. S/N-304-OC-R1]